MSGAERGPARPVLCLAGRPRPRHTRRCRPSGAEPSRSPQRHCRLQPAMAGEPVLLLLLLPRARRGLSPALPEKPRRRRRLPRRALPSARRGHCSRLPPAVTSIPAPRRRLMSRPPSPDSRGSPLPPSRGGGSGLPGSLHHVARPPFTLAARLLPLLRRPYLSPPLSLFFSVLKPFHVLRAGGFFGSASPPARSGRRGRGHLPGARPGRLREGEMPEVGTCGRITCPARQRRAWGFIRGWGVVLSLFHGDHLYFLGFFSLLCNKMGGRAVSLQMGWRNAG